MDIPKETLLKSLVKPGFDAGMLERAAEQFLDDCADYTELMAIPESLAYILMANALEAAVSITVEENLQGNDGEFEETKTSWKNLQDPTGYDSRYDPLG